MRTGLDFKRRRPLLAVVKITSTVKAWKQANGKSRAPWWTRVNSGFKNGDSLFFHDSKTKSRTLRSERFRSRSDQSEHVSDEVTVRTQLKAPKSSFCLICQTQQSVHCKRNSLNVPVSSHSEFIPSRSFCRNAFTSGSTPVSDNFSSIFRPGQFKSSCSPVLDQV